MSWFSKRTKEAAVTVNIPVGEALNHGVARLPNRADGIVTVTVGLSYVLLSPKEAREFASTILSFANLADEETA
jgi:hypothetical protein